VPFCLDRCLDDFILLVMLVGNDFLPPLPGFNVIDDGLECIWEVRCCCPLACFARLGEAPCCLIVCLLACLLTRPATDNRADVQESTAAAWLPYVRGRGGAANETRR
jgi:hypothetical protein